MKFWQLYLIIFFTLCSCKAQTSKGIEIPAPIKNSEELILERLGYTTSYDPDMKIPKWVAWHLIAEHTDGAVQRINGYQEDEDVPLPRSTQDDYRGSAWSHGHMCPAGDNKWDETAMRESNLLTNLSSTSQS